MLSMDKVSKQDFGRITEYFCAKNLTSGFVQVSEFFSIVVLDDVNDGGTPYMGISPGRTRPCTHPPEREQPINTLQSAALHGTRSGRTSLKKCVFGCEGKITLFSFPKEPTVT